MNFVVETHDVLEKFLFGEVREDTAAKRLNRVGKVLRI